MKKYFLILVVPILLVCSGCSVGSLRNTFQFARDSISVSSVPNDVHVVIVPGYGAPVSGNSTYEEYIKSVVDFATNADNGVDWVVFSGGYTSQKDLSEAEAMRAYFADQLSEMSAQQPFRVAKEECAIVSWQNITYVQALLKKQSVMPDRITLFGDVNRKDKLLLLATAAFNQDIAVPDSASELLTQGINSVSVAFNGYDFGGTPAEKTAQAASFLAEIAGSASAELGNHILRARIEQWTTQFGYDVADNLVAKGCPQYAGFQ